LQAQTGLSAAICFGCRGQSVIVLVFIFHKFLPLEEICRFLLCIRAALQPILLDIESSGPDYSGFILYIVLTAERQRLYCGICYRALVLSG